MQNKSNIQLIYESIQEKENILQSFNEFLNKYDVIDAVFEYSNGIHEITSGYFEIIKESDNIKDIIMNGYDNKKCIRIKGDKFQLCEHYKNMSEAKNISTLFEIKSI